MAYPRRSSAQPATAAAARQALERFCARRERAPSEVLRRIASLGLSSDESQALWAHLVRERYVDEQRFARAFSTDKLRLERWGRLRIRQALRQRGISESAIEQALQGLDPEEYAEAFRHLREQKRRHYAGQPQADLKVRAALFRAGFEPDLNLSIDESET